MTAGPFYLQTMDMGFDRLAILGVGLIGGSFGLAWKRAFPESNVVGYDRAAVLDRAKAKGAIDESRVDLIDAVAQADLVVLATPIATMLRQLDAIAPHLKAGAVVTDVGSVKQPIATHAAETLRSDTPFIPGHPMAGSEHGGIDHADALLFENATYVLCPPPQPTEAFAHLSTQIEQMGARVLHLAPEQHDRIAAAVSHLPQLLAVNLMNVAANLHDVDDQTLKLAAGGFRNMTRIASSPFRPWRDIVVGNQGPILDMLAALAAELQATRNRIIEEDLDGLDAAFTRSRTMRDTIPKDTKGFLTPLFDLYVYVEDVPGVLYFITKTLYEDGINIKDIELLKIREGTGGAFRLSVARADEADRAVAALENYGYTAYRL
ncbi:MAG: prephenate dehydrogenase [Rhodothermales bacterium]